jgi:hypothetical protein
VDVALDVAAGAARAERRLDRGSHGGPLYA